MGGSGNFLFVGDIHYAAGRYIPEGRSEQYPQQVLAKLQFVADQAREHQAHLCFVGDFLHSKHPSWQDVVTMGAYLYGLQERGIRAFAIAGNHDAPNVQAALHSSPFATWCVQGLLHHLDPDAHGYATQEHHGVRGVFLTGATYRPGYSEDGTHFAPSSTLPHRPQDIVLHLSHGVLWLRDEVPPFPHYRPPSKFPRRGLCVNGDLHAPIMQQLEDRPGGPQGYINLGSLVRTSRTKTQAQHKPFLLLVRVEEGGTKNAAYTLEWIPVPHAAPGAVFVVPQVKPAASNEEIRAFAEDLREADAVEAYGDTDALLENVLHKGGYGTDVRQRVQELLGNTGVTHKASS